VEGLLVNCFNIEMLLWGTDVVVNLTVRELVWRGAGVVLGWCGAVLVWWYCG
jgi:hypothetical protein